MDYFVLQMIIKLVLKTMELYVTTLAHNNNAILILLSK